MFKYLKFSILAPFDNIYCILYYYNINMEKVVVFRAWKDGGVGFWTVQFGRKETSQVGVSVNFTDVSDAVDYAKGLRIPGSGNMLFIGESDKKPYKLPK